MKDRPAFPQPIELVPSFSEGTHKFGGLTKREYFACAAMQGLLASPWASRATIGSVDCQFPKNHSVALLAVANADALILELEKK